MLSWVMEMLLLSMPIATVTLTQFPLLLVCIPPVSTIKGHLYSKFCCRYVELQLEIMH